MARSLNQRLPQNYEELDGITKAAILMMTLETHAAGTLLKQLPPEAVEEVTRVLAGLGRVPDHIRRAVVAEFYAVSVESDYLTEGGLEYAKVLLKESLEPQK